MKYPFMSLKEFEFTLIEYKKRNYIALSFLVTI